MRTLKIVFGTDAFYPFLGGGGEVHTFKVAKNLVKFGHEVTVLSGKTSQYPEDTTNRLRTLKDEEVVDGIKIIRSKKPYKYGSTMSSLPALFEMYRTLKRMIRNDEVDIVNFVLYRPCVPFFMAARKKVPTVLTTHLLSEGFGDWKGWMDYDAGIIGGLAQKTIENIVLRFPYDRIVTVSETLRNGLSRYYPKEKIDVVYNGVDLEQYDCVEAGEKNRNQVMYVGALKKRKNILDAVKAVEKVRKEINDLKLVIVSGGGECEDIVRRIGEKEAFIEYHKKATDEEKIRLLKESSLFVFPTSKEGFPLVPIEALGCNTPFLGYNIPEMKEVQELTRGGVLVSYGNVEALSQKMCELLEDESELKRLGEIGRKNVEKKITWETIAKKEEEIFDEIIKNKNRRY